MSIWPPFATPLELASVGSDETASLYYAVPTGDEELLDHVMTVRKAV